MADAEASHRTKGLLRLTMACNERCPFCNVPVEDYPRPTPPEAEVLAGLAAFAGEQTVTISGGEPTLLRARLLRLVRAARERVPFVEIQTNAVLIDPRYAADLAAAGVTSAFVSLLSDVPALHDHLAGLGGAFPRCLAGIDALLDAGIRVTLNPVTAYVTQERLPAYVDFVAARLPRVRSISVSAVQPHGRAASHLDLLPDYAILGPAVRAARERAAFHGIELVNPYCGLPLCVGWDDALDVSVEAVEARDGGGAPGLENTGDKHHGPQCRVCVLRGRCGGAWHAYWEVRAGSGIVPPRRLEGPWGDDAPFVWGDDGVYIELATLSVPSLRPIHRLVRQARRPVIWVGVTPTLALATAELVRALDLDALVLLDPRAEPLAAGLRQRGIDVRVR